MPPKGIRWVYYLGLAAFLLMVLLPSQAVAVELDLQVREVARKIRCPVCKNQSVWDSETTPARQIVEDVRERLAKGQTAEQILADYEEMYGPWILMYPPRRGAFWVAWLMPAAAVAMGGTAVVLLLRRWLRETPQAAQAEAVAPSLSAGDADRLRGQVAKEWRHYF